MTSCKEINKGKNKPNIFDVRIDVNGCDEINARDAVAKRLREIGWDFTSDLADIIERG